jgi:hypothetical protein
MTVGFTSGTVRRTIRATVATPRVRDPVRRCAGEDVDRDHSGPAGDKKIARPDLAESHRRTASREYCSLGITAHHSSAPNPSRNEFDIRCSGGVIGRQGDLLLGLDRVRIGLSDAAHRR